MYVTMSENMTYLAGLVVDEHYDMRMHDGTSNESSNKRSLHPLQVGS
jgi:hypothetical protein